ncbi:MAG: hydrogenase formation protein HypD [Bacillota bacterium]
MKQLLNRFRDPELAVRILERVWEKAHNVALMEVCGTHTVAISQTGIRGLLEGKVDFRSGPGCPVCVTDTGDIDGMISCAGIPGVILTTFGDMMRVPGSRTSLEQERAGGADVRVVYSPLDAVRTARENPGREVVFLGVGFETTAPVVALALEQAEALGLSNFSIYAAHKLTPPAVDALLGERGVAVKGFICPGHVSAVIGRQGWEFIGEKYGIPAVIAGFDPVDILGALETLLSMIESGESRVANGYPRAVGECGNVRALSLMKKYFTESGAGWRGIGYIPASGLCLRGEYAGYDAARKFQISVSPASPPPGCACGDVLKGKLTPPECSLFGISCTPEGPVGPCMVSGEGACAAYYKYNRGGGAAWRD